MKKLLLAVAFATTLSVTATIGQAQQIPDPRVADLVQAGKIRVGLFLPQFSKDAVTGELKGVRVEIARALAARIGVQIVLLEHPTPPAAVACLKASACDFLFLSLDARPADAGDFSPPVFQFDYTLLVPAGSAIRGLADADRLGVRIAAIRNHSSTTELIRLLKQAEIVYADTPDPTFDLLRTGQAAAMASARPMLLDYSDKLHGSRVLEARYGANINRMVVPKGKAGWLAYISEFVEEAKALGLVQKAIDRAEERGITVSAPGDSK